ncbi:MAG: tRNA (adenosine(37)-N6)-threonylcarbamoyltransferase complex ATPase subunit type 1 TsaE [Gammaproteobacteria bacterium]|nr:tRNA (adenosine(37)-N6)-threonylcarbamoyltransferase complex ATPase subunit type 1 TsaE [Gammaproteobacteria bacterium]
MEVGGSVTGVNGGVVAFPDEASLEAFANEFACSLRAPMVIWLEGDLGAGKTTFARGLIHALGYKGRVKSPTYGLLEQYQTASLQVLHMDLYRISDPEELEFLGITDLMDEGTVLLVEWPDRGGQWLPDADFVFRFVYAHEGRDLHWSARTRRAKAMDHSAFNT